MNRNLFFILEETDPVLSTRRWPTHERQSRDGMGECRRCGPLTE
jgi:hypothetical protein